MCCFRLILEQTAQRLWVDDEEILHSMIQYVGDYCGRSISHALTNGTFEKTKGDGNKVCDGCS
jgi:hypothetical protein